MSPQDSTRWLKWLLRLDGLIMMTAALAVGIPDNWMGLIHSSLGLGDWPAAPITGYLARSCSLLYAIHGCIVFALSLDVVKYQQLVRLVLWLHIVLGSTLLWIDLDSGMPVWWTAFEGPGIIGFSVLMLALLRRASQGRRLSHSPDNRVASH